MELGLELGLGLGLGLEVLLELRLRAAALLGRRLVALAQHALGLRREEEGGVRMWMWMCGG